MSMQFIRFSETEGGSLIKNFQLDPTFEWPPPEFLWSITPHGMGFEHCLLVTDVEVADQLAEFMDEPDNRERNLGYTMTPWRQVSCSILDDEAVPEGGFVARGAEYVPMQEDPA